MPNPSNLVIKFDVEKIDWKKITTTFDVALTELSVGFARMARVATPLTYVINDVTLKFAPPVPPSFQILDIASPAFARYMVERILDRYEIPACDEVAIVVTRNLVSLNTAIWVYLFDVKQCVEVPDILLVMERDPSSFVADHIMRVAELCWQEVLQHG